MLLSATMVHSMLVYIRKVTVLIAIIVAYIIGASPGAASAALIRVEQTKSVSLAPSVNCRNMSAAACERASAAAAKPAPAPSPVVTIKPAPPAQPAPVITVKTPVAVGPVKTPFAVSPVIIPVFILPVKVPVPTNSVPSGPSVNCRNMSAAACERSNGGATTVTTVKPPVNTTTNTTTNTATNNTVTNSNSADDPSTMCGLVTIYQCQTVVQAQIPDTISRDFRIIDNFAPNESTVCKPKRLEKGDPCWAGETVQIKMDSFDKKAGPDAVKEAQSGKSQVTIVFTGYNTIANASTATDNEKNSAMRAAQSASDFCGSTATIKYTQNGQVNKTAVTDKCVIVHANINKPGYAAALSECESQAKAAQKVCALTTPQSVINNNYNTNGLRVTSATIITKPIQRPIPYTTTTTTTTVPCNAPCTTTTTTTTVPVCNAPCTTTTTAAPNGNPGGSNNNPGDYLCASTYCSNNNPGGSNNNPYDPSNGNAGSTPDYSDYPEAIDPDTGEPWVVSLLVDVKVPANYVANGKKTALTATVTLLCGGSPCGSNSLIDSEDVKVTMSQKFGTGLCTRPTQLNCLYYAPENSKKQPSPATYTMYFYTPSPSARQITTTLSVDATITRIIPLEDGSTATATVDDYRRVYRANGVGTSSEISRPVLGSRG